LQTDTLKVKRNEKLQGELLTKCGIYQVSQLFGEDNTWAMEKELREAWLTLTESMEGNGIRVIVKACSIRLGITPAI